MLVGLCLEPSLEMVICVLGTLKAGGAYVSMDPLIRPKLARSKTSLIPTPASAYSGSSEIDYRHITLKA